MAKILIDGRMYGLENKGIGRYLVNLIRELSQIDHDNSYVLLLRSKYFNKLDLPINWKKIKAEIPHYSYKEQLYLPSLISRCNPDLFHAPQINFPILYKGRLIVTVHDLTQLRFDMATSKLPKIVYLVKNVGLKFVFSMATHRATKIIVPTKYVEDQLITRGVAASKINQMYYGYSKLSFEISSERKYPLPSKYFVYAGSCFPHKNLKFLIDVICEVDANLLIVGSRDKFVEDLEKYVIDNKLSKKVMFTGYVTDEFLGHIYNKSQAFVFPSHSEGFGLPGLEAISSGTLLLSSDIPVLKEVYNHSAIYFDPKDKNSLVDAMNKVLNMKMENRKSIIKNSQKILEKYTWNKMAINTLKLYENVLEN